MIIQTVEEYLQSETYKRRQKSKKIYKERIIKEANNILENKNLTVHEKNLIKLFFNDNCYKINPGWGNRTIAFGLVKKEILKFSKKVFILKNIKTDDLDLSWNLRRY